MDSEHRHELEENDLAKWLAAQYEEVKPRLPVYGATIAGLVVLVLAVNGWRGASAAAQANRWRAFQIAVEQGNPNPDLLQEAAAQNPGTAVADWAEITWADAKLFEASSSYFRNRETAEAAAEEALAVYERLASDGGREIAERAGYQLARTYELLGKLDEAREQYGRVTGAFAEVAKTRAEQLESSQLKESYDWITSTATASVTAKLDPEASGPADFEPDDIEMPSADDTLQGLLDSVGAQIDEQEAQAEAEAAEQAEDSLESLIEQSETPDPTQTEPAQPEPETGPAEE